MARELNMDTRRQNFWKEAVKKESYVRLAWHKAYRNEVPDRNSESAQHDRIRRRKKEIESMVPKPPSRSLTLPTINYPKKPKRAAAVSLPTNGDADALLVEMRPVSPFVRKLLYDGFTKEGKGRAQYLSARTAKIPEVKYGFPLTTSWEYGWRLNDVVKEFHAPKYGRSRIVRDSFYRRNGPMYQPITA